MFIWRECERASALSLASFFTSKVLFDDRYSCRRHAQIFWYSIIKLTLRLAYFIHSKINHSFIQIGPFSSEKCSARVNTGCKLYWKGAIYTHTHQMIFVGVRSRARVCEAINSHKSIGKNQLNTLFCRVFDLFFAFSRFYCFKRFQTSYKLSHHPERKRKNQLLQSAKSA